MDAREKMIELRTKNDLSFEYISDKTGVSQTLISLVENGQVTHPLIVEKLAKFYKLTKLEAEQLLPVNRRKHSKEYEPDKYVIKVKYGADRIMPRQTLIERYMTEHLEDQAKLHAKRSNYR